MIKTKYIPVIVVVLIVIFLSLAYTLAYSDVKEVVNGISTHTISDSFPDLKSSDRIIIFAPHPDDETLGNSAIIRKAVEKNATVLIVMMTNGDYFSPDFLHKYLNATNNTAYKGNIGELRHTEALNAIKKLGLNESNIIFLGYPDAGLKELLINNWDYNNLFKMSKGSNQYDHSPYSFSYEKNAPYCGANVEKNIDQIMDDFNPNIILIPDDGDDHHDHWATSAFVRYVAVENNYNGSMYNYLVHKGNSWPSPLYYSPNDDLLPPPEILELDATWMKLNLNKSDEKLKREAVTAHETQLFAMKNLLESFIRKNEVYSVYPMILLKKNILAYNPKNGMPSSSYKDLKNDAETDSLQMADDLTAAGLAYDDQHLYLLLNSKQYEENYYYIFHLFLYDGNDFKRIDIQVNNGTAQYLFKASDDIKLAQNPEVQHESNLTSVQVPVSLINGTKYILMTVDVQSSQNGNIMDNIAMRVFKIVS